MSFISVKNFAAPITNRVNLIGLLLCIILFAVFRLSGGRIEARQVGQSGTPEDLYGSDSAVMRESRPAVNPKLFPGEGRFRESSEDDIFQVKPRAGNRPPGDQGAGSAKGLDEIEQMLGGK